MTDPLLFHNAISRYNIKTFQSSCKSVVIKRNNKTKSINDDRNILGALVSYSIPLRSISKNNNSQKPEPKRIVGKCVHNNVYICDSMAVNSYISNVMMLFGSCIKNYESLAIK